MELAFEIETVNLSGCIFFLLLIKIVFVVKDVDIFSEPNCIKTTAKYNTILMVTQKMGQSAQRPFSYHFSEEPSETNTLRINLNTNSTKKNTEPR